MHMYFHVCTQLQFLLKNLYMYMYTASIPAEQKAEEMAIHLHSFNEQKAEQKA